jgi:hypothetical protein
LLVVLLWRFCRRCVVWFGGIECHRNSFHIS